MNTIDKGLAFRGLARILFFSLPCLTDKLCYRTIGQQHKLLNELCGICRFLEIATGGLTVVINVKV